MIIGCVKEIKKHEYRVGLTPDNAKQYIRHGHRVLMERGAGEASGFLDEDYAASGAQMTDAATVWNDSEMIIKVKEPLEEEYPLLREGQILYTYLHLAANRTLTDELLKVGTKGVAYETLVDAEGRLPLLQPMSEIAGRLAAIEGAKYLEKPFGGKGILMPGVPGVRKAEVLVLGGGVVGVNAARMALGLGADVTIMDISLSRLSEIDAQYNGRIKTICSTNDTIERALNTADLVIGAVLIPGAATPRLVRKEQLKRMQPGSVIVDVAVDQGGCFETTHITYHDDPTYTVDGVLHYCVANMPGSVPYTSTMALTNATIRYGLLIADHGLEGAVKVDPAIRSGINTYRGALTHPGVAEAFGLTCDALPIAE